MDERRQVQNTMAVVRKANVGVLLAMGALFVVSLRLTKAYTDLAKELRLHAIQAAAEADPMAKIDEMVQEYSERVN